MEACPAQDREKNGSEIVPHGGLDAFILDWALIGPLVGLQYWKSLFFMTQKCPNLTCSKP